MRETIKSIAEFLLTIIQIVIYALIWFVFAACVIVISVMIYGATFDRVTIAYYHEHYWPSAGIFLGAGIGAGLLYLLLKYLRNRWQHLGL